MIMIPVFTDKKIPGLYDLNNLQCKSMKQSNISLFLCEYKYIVNH